MSPLTEHYVDVLRLIERLALARVPKFMRGRGLSDQEILLIANELVVAHDIAAEVAG